MKFSPKKLVQRFWANARLILADHPFPTVLAAGLFFVVTLFLIPVPRWLLDLCIALNIIFSMALLLHSAFIRSRTQLFYFPLLLLLTTLYRLALNISSSRLILLNGEQGTGVAGRVIEAFGLIVVRGDFYVGAIIFALIAVINFFVITRGSARVAEVAARFTLDALPGKQLAIDADLRAELISREDAQSRRLQLAQESEFFGSMDGAMRFVQGDAVATIIIAAVNVVGGSALGMIRGMTFADALATFGVLAIGDGLVSILPALLISVCAGFVVTRHSSSIPERSNKTSVGLREVFVVAGLFSLLIGLLPGFPLLPFAAIGLAVIFTGWAVGKGEEYPTEYDTASTDVSADSMVLEIPPGTDDAVVLGAFKLQRDSVFNRRGVMLPELTLRQGSSPDRYRVFARGREVTSGEVRRGLLYCESAPTSLASLGVEIVQDTLHPVDGRRCCWVKDSSVTREILLRISVTFHPMESYLALEATGVALKVVEEFFGMEQVKNLLAVVRQRSPQLVDEVVSPKLLSRSELVTLLRGLVIEGVNVRDLELILEGVSEFALAAAQMEDRAEFLTRLHSYIRIVLARGIIADSVGPGDRLRAFGVSAAVEEEFRAAIPYKSDRRGKFPLEPEFENTLKETAKRLFLPIFERGALPVVVVCSGDVRPAVHDFLGRLFGSRFWFQTLAFEELREQPVDTVGTMAI